MTMALLKTSLLLNILKSQAIFSRSIIYATDNYYKPLLTLKRKVNAGTSPIIFIQFSSKMDNLLHDPRRHFDYDTLLSKKKDGAILIIDVRQPEELAATGTIPESINIPLKDIGDALGATTPEAFRMKYGVDKPSKGTLIVFSCQSGRRSVVALEQALFHGYLNAGNFKGGWLEWESHTKQQ